MQQEIIVGNYSPIVLAIYKLYYDKNGGIISSASKIGAQLGISRNAVIGYMGRNRDLFPKQNDLAPRKPRDTTFDKKEYNLNYNRQYRIRQKAKLEAEASGIEQSAVALLGSGRKNRRRAANTNKSGINKNHLLGEKFDSIVTVEENISIPEGQIGRPLVTLKNNECRYVVDDTEGAMLMCGKVFHTYPYCTNHARLTYR